MDFTKLGLGVLFSVGMMRCIYGTCAGLVYVPIYDFL